MKPGEYEELKYKLLCKHKKYDNDISNRANGSDTIVLQTLSRISDLYARFRHIDYVLLSQWVEEKTIKYPRKPYDEGYNQGIQEILELLKEKEK